MDTNQKQSVNKGKPGLSVINVQSFNEIEILPTQMRNVFFAEFVSESDKDKPKHGAIEKESEINGIITKSGERPEANSSEHGICLGLSSNNEETTKQVGVPEMDVIICSPNSKDSFATNETIVDGELFSLRKVTTINCKEWLAKCNLCKPSKEFRGDLKIASNFRTHLKRDHGDVIADEVLKQISKKARILEEHNNGIKHNQTIQNNLPPTPSAPSKSAESSIDPLDNQMQFNTNVFNYFIKSFTPLSVVELPEFWGMFNHLGATVPRINKEHLTKQIRTTFKVQKNRIITLLKDVDFVCIATDSWSSKLHSFIAVTCHWIDAVTFKRISVALACKRFDSCADALRSQEFVKQTLMNYSLSKDKITTSVTQNFYDFCKLFKDLDIPTTQSLPYTCSMSENNSFQTTMEPSPYISYTKKLSLIATIDIPNIIDSKHSLRAIHYSALKKVFLFLFLARSNDTLARVLADFKKPDFVKWNSIYDSIAYFLKLEETRSFNDMFDLLNMEKFTSQELVYLREYVKCVGPLAMAFERLQCQRGSYHGLVLPSLIELRKKCEKLEESKDLVLCYPILKTILAKSLQRFDKFFNVSRQPDHHVIIASVSHPFFKEKWVPGMEGLQKEIVRAIFIEAVKNENSKFNDARTNVQDEDEEQMEEFYFGEEYQKDNSKGKLSVQLEALRFLSDDRRNLKILDDYPAVKRVFLKFNTPLSSSEPVNKICPFETRQIISSYGYLAEEFFEERVLVFLNKDVLES